MAVGNVVALTTSPQQLNVPSGGVTIINLTNTPVQLSPDITMRPGPIPFPHRPMWNNAPPTIYRQRVSNANSAQNVVQYNPVKYSTVGNNYNGTASISPSGTYQGQVLL